MSNLFAEIENDYNLFSRFKWGKFRVYTFNKGLRVGYRVFMGENELMSRDDYRPAPTMNWDSVEAMTSLLGFLTVQPGDTDNEYFKNHSPAMMAFVNSPLNEEIKHLISDIESGEPEYSKPAIARFKRHFKQF